MSRVMKGASHYADIALKDGTDTASAVFMSDYLKGVWSRMEHIAIMLLTQKYIDCKQGAISREECLQEQRKILMRCEIYEQEKNERQVCCRFETASAVGA